MIAGTRLEAVAFCMISDSLEQRSRYAGLHPRFAAAFEFLEKLTADHATGRFEIDGSDCFALVQSYSTQPRHLAKVETHRQYIDIQFMQAGRELMLWSPHDADTKATEPYVAERDVIFYATPSQMTPLNLGAGQFVIFFPNDCHAGGIECDGPAPVRKVVIKVRVAL